MDMTTYGRKPKTLKPQTDITTLGYGVQVYSTWTLRAARQYLMVSKLPHLSSQKGRGGLGVTVQGTKRLKLSVPDWVVPIMGNKS